MTVQHSVVTGAGGYIGRHVVSQLLALGHEVTAIVRPGSRRDVDPRAHVLELDVLDPATDVSDLVSGHRTTLIHLAWQDGFNHNASSHMELLSAHYRFLLSAVEAGVSRLAVLGTMHEVGYWEGAIDAETPTNPISLYGIAKDALRRALFASVADRVTFQWLRCFYILGDDLNNQSIFTRLLQAAARGDSEFPFTSGVNKYDFIEVDELAEQIAVVASQDAVHGVINCSSGAPIALGAKVESFIESRGLKLDLKYGAYPDRQYDSPGVWGDATVIQELLGSRAEAR